MENKMGDEIDQLKKQCDELLKERDTAIQEKDRLKQQCTEAIRQWNLILQERNGHQEIIKKMRSQHEEDVKELKVSVANSLLKNAELGRLKKAYREAVQEYNLVMSERDNVHNEIEKLSSDLAIANNKNEELEKEVNSYKDEIKSLQWYIECFKREVSLVMYDRDAALKKCHDYQEIFGDITNNECQTGHQSDLNESVNREKENKIDLPEKEASPVLFGFSQNEPIDDLDEAHQEIERLRILVNQNYIELNKSLEEAKLSKRSRDLAFEERDKIILEREHLRSLSDSLRKQRNSAENILTHITKDSDSITEKLNDFTIDNKYVDYLK